MADSQEMERKHLCSVPCSALLFLMGRGALWEREEDWPTLLISQPWCPLPGWVPPGTEKPGQPGFVEGWLRPKNSGPWTGVLSKCTLIQALPMEGM